MTNVMCCLLIAACDYFVVGILAQLMSGQPGDIPKFVSEMIGPMATEELQPVRPMSEVAQPSGQTQPVCDDRPKSDIPRASDTTRLSYQAHQKSYELQGQEPSTPVNDGPSISGGRGTVPCISQTPPQSTEKPDTGLKSDIPRVSDATRLSYQAHQKSQELERQEPSTPVNDGPLTSGEPGTGPRLSQTPPKSDIPRASDPMRLSYQAHQKSVELERQQPSQPVNYGPSTSGELGSIPRLSQTLPKSVEKPGAGLKDEKSASLTINKETERLVEELQRYYAQPIFINDGVQFFVDDAKERSILSTSGSSRQQKSEKSKRVCPFITVKPKVDLISSGLLRLLHFLSWFLCS